MTHKKPVIFTWFSTESEILSFPDSLTFLGTKPSQQIWIVEKETFCREFWSLKKRKIKVIASFPFHKHTFWQDCNLVNSTLKETWRAEDKHWFFRVWGGSYPPNLLPFLHLVANEGSCLDFLSMTTFGGPRVKMVLTVDNYNGPTREGDAALLIGMSSGKNT